MLRPIATLTFLITANLAASAATVHIVAFGDSATLGYLVPRTQAYPAQLQALLRKKGYDAVVANEGVNGDTIAGALKRFNHAIAPGTDIAIVEFGTNDLRSGASTQAVRTRLTGLIRALRARGIAVLVVGLGHLDLTDVARVNGALYAVACRKISRARRRPFQCRGLCNRGRAHVTAGGDADFAPGAQMT